MTTTTSRRAIMAGVAALPALATPAALANTPDPIFAAIEVHRAAHVEHSRCVAFADVVPGTATPPGAEEAVEAASAAEYEAIINLLNTHATTLTGLAALARYVEALGGENWMNIYDAGAWRNFGDCLIVSMADALDEIVRQVQT